MMPNTAAVGLDPRRRASLIRAAIVTVGLAAAPVSAEQARPAKPVPLSALTAQGFEIRAATGNQSGVLGTLVLQKDKDVFLCESKDLSIQPTAFECWPIK
jgi:hypothetical protein